MTAQSTPALRRAGRRSRELSRAALPAAALAAAFVALGTTGCGRRTGAHALPPPEVATLAVSTTRTLLTTELPGRTSPYLIAEVRPQVNGLVQKRLFAEGSDVKAGQVLYEIDPAPFKAALDSAAANLEAAKRAAERTRAALSASQAGVVRQQAATEFARATRGRFEELLKEKAVSANDCEQAVSAAKEAEAALQACEAQVLSDQGAIAAADAAVLQATAALETARINLGYTKITAPIAGRIGKSTVTDGAIVTAYQPTALAAIQQLDPIYVDVPQSTVDLLKLRQRLKDGRVNGGGADVSKVQLVLEDGTPYAAEGDFQFRDVSVDTSTGSVVLRMVFPNPDGVLLPGMFVRAVIKEGVAEKAVLIPQQAISRDPKGTPLALVVNASHVVEARRLVLERAIGDQWLVGSGLDAGDQLIVEGLMKARPGIPVTVVPFGQAQAPQPAAPASSPAH